MRLSIAFARSIFIAIPNERQVKSFADDLIMQRGGVSTRGVLLLRCTEPQPLLLDLENKSPPLPKRSRVTPPPRTNPPTRTLTPPHQVPRAHHLPHQLPRTNSPHLPRLLPASRKRETLTGHPTCFLMQAGPNARMTPPPTPTPPPSAPPLRGTPFAAQLNAHGSSNKRSRVIHGPCAPGSFWRAAPTRRDGRKKAKRSRVTTN